MTTISPPAALSPADSARVAAMAAVVPLEQNLADERGLMLALHRLRFPAADIALLAPYVAAKARELRAALGLDDPREAVAGLFFFLAMASAAFFFCFVAPEEAEAHSLAPAHELYGPFAWLLATCSLSIFIIGAWRTGADLGEWLTHRRDLREPLAPLGEGPICTLSLDAEAGELWSKARWADFDARIEDLFRRAWHVYIAMGMSGDLDSRPPHRLTSEEIGDAFAFAACCAHAPRDELADEGDDWSVSHRALFEAA